MKKAIMEFLGTFFLVLTVVLTANPLAIAAILMAWIYIGAYVSGGHYNPAVSFGAAVSQRLSWHSFYRYVAAQILGGVAAYAFASYLVGRIAIPAPGVSFSIWQAFIVEALLAFVFVLVVLNVAMSDKYKSSSVFGFAIGFTIPALVYLGGPISGGLFNPAIALGANIFGVLRGASISWENLIMYVGGALLGGFLAAYAFKYFVLDEKR